MTIRSRKRSFGCLMGQSIGDALGTTLEFRMLPSRPWSFDPKPPYRPITGGGPFRVAPGQVTDDTQLAVALAQSLLRCGAFHPGDILDRYAEWRRGAFDVGGQTSGSISRHLSGSKHPGYDHWADGGRRAAGNGSLMRTSPLGVWLAGLPQRDICNVSRDESALTHADPLCMMACAAFNCAIAHAITYPNPSPASMVVAASYGLTESRHDMMRHNTGKGHGYIMYDPEVIRTAAAALDLDLHCAMDDDPALYGGGLAGALNMHSSQGFVRVAFRLAFWELMHAPTFEAGLIDCVDRGGDADTNGAIAGALLGAYFGRDNIPGEWIDTVLGALKEEPTSRWWNEYHPRFLLEMVP